MDGFGSDLNNFGMILKFFYFILKEVCIYRFRRTYKMYILQTLEPGEIIGKVWVILGSILQ